MKISHWLREVVRRLAPHRKLLIILLLLTGGGAALAAVPPLLIGRIIDRALPAENRQQLLVLAMGVLGALASGELLIALRQYLAAVIVLRLNRGLRLDVFQSVLYTRAEFLKSTPRGDILQRCVDDMESLQQFGLDTLPNSFQELIAALVAMTVITRIYWPLGILGVIVYALYLVPVRYFGKIQRRVAAGLRNQSAALQQILQENLETVRLIKTYGAESREYKHVLAQQNRWADLVLRRYVTENMFRNLPRILDAFAPALVFAVGGYQVFTGRLTVGTLVTITGLLPAVNAPFRSFSATFLAMQDVGARMERVVEYLDLPAEPGRQKGLTPAGPLAGAIEFHMVSYSTDRGPLLRDISFSLHPGEHVALVGRSGAGKSTILQLIGRLIEPDGGMITIDGKPLAEMDATSLRRRIGIVTQEPVLFNTTVAENLRYANHAAAQAEVERIAAMTGAAELIAFLADGYETVIGEKGSTLSGGQKQRLALARALLGKPDLLILDEATAALDRRSEARVLEAIREAMKGKTCLFVTHRLPAVANVDRILVIDDGRLVEQGNHSDLLRKGGLYARLWKQNCAQMEEDAPYVLGAGR